MYLLKFKRILKYIKYKEYKVYFNTFIQYILT